MPNITFMSAGAGSGKTFRLTTLLEERLTQKGVDPSGVLATTFTRKAAAELRERVRSHLLRQGRLDLANGMGEALIGTVNSLAGALLQRFAFEAGLSPDLRVLEDAECAMLLRQELDDAIDDSTRKSLTDIAARMSIENWTVPVFDVIKLARSNDVAPSALAAMAERNADAVLALLPVPQKHARAKAVLAVIEKALPALESAALESTVKKTAQYLQLVRSFKVKLERDGATWSDWLDLVSAEPEKGLVHLAQPICEAAAEYEKDPQLHADIRGYLRLVFAAAATALEGYGRRKRDIGALDFIDQELLLLRLLDQPVVADVLRDELQLLLVDEFQDTSPIQLALFMKLADFAHETIWVGDIKQAIYGFRGSDTALMESVIAALPRLNGKIEVLDSSYRSTPELVDLVNRVFVPAFSPTLTEDKVALQAKRAPLPNTTALEVWTLSGKNIGLRMAALAGQIRATVASGMQVCDRETKQMRPVRYGDIAVLCQLNSRIPDVVAALKSLGLPSATASAGLLGTPEAALALACLRRVHDARDTVATAEILALGDCAEPEAWLADRLSFLAAGGDPAHWQEAGDNPHPLMKTLAAIRDQLPVLTPREAMERVIAQGDVAGRVVAWCHDEIEAGQRLANLDRLLEMAGSYEEACRATDRPASLAGLLLWLDEQAAAELDKQADVAADAVQVMTHHAAKGLEWPVVVLLDLDGPVRDRTWGLGAVSTGSLDVDAPLASRFIRFWPWAFGKKQKVPMAERAAQTEDGRRLRAAAVEEMKRLLYVSMTRARDQLILALPEAVWDGGCWLGVTGAEWLLTGKKADAPVLAAGVPVTSMLREATAPDMPDPAERERKTLWWFAAAPAGSPRQALFIRPSAAEPRRCTADPAVQFCDGVTVRPGADTATVGTAIHAYIAASMCSVAPLSHDEGDALLRRFGVRDEVSLEQLSQAASSLKDWMSAQWPGATPAAEVPVTSTTADGRILNGLIDVLVPLEKAFVVGDHKNPARTWHLNRPDALFGYAGQMGGYGEQLPAMADVERVDYVVFLPTAGRAIRIALE